MKKSILLCLAFGCFYHYVLSQESLMIRNVSSSGEIKFAEINSDLNPIEIKTSPEYIRNLLNLSAEDELKLIRTTKDELGYEHHLFYQFYNGVRVEYHNYGIHGKNGRIEKVLGNFDRVKNINVTPSLSEKEALELALTHIGAKKYRWQDIREELGIKELKSDPDATYYPKGMLFITKFPDQNIGFTLVYKFNIYSLEPASAKYIYINAHTGKVVHSGSIGHTANAQGTAVTKYSGTQTITTNSTGTNFQLQQTGRGVALTIRNAKNQTSLSGSVHFTDNDNNWTANEHDNVDMDNAALDAYWGLEKTFDYFMNVHGRNSFAGNGSQATISFAHVDMGSVYDRSNDNAVWDQVNWWVAFGDGVTRFKPLTSLDVVAHELGHGYTQFFVSPDGSSGMADEFEPRAINEGLSDIWGAVVEQWAAPNKQTWKIGEDIMKNGKPCLRSLQNPNSGGDPGGSSTGGYPDTYGGSYWHSDQNSTGHTNSTIMSHWFYLLSQGGNGANDNGHNFSVNGIGITSSARIVFRLQNEYLADFPAPTFNDIRTISIQAAKDLFCNGSKEEVAVTNAWRAVGVGSPFSGNAISITGLDPLCTSTTYSVINQPSGVSSLAWSSSYSSGVSINSSNGFAQRLSSYNGSVTINASITATGCATVATRTIWSGTPQITNQKVDGNSYYPGMQICPGNHWLMVTPVGGNPSTATWTVPAGIPYYVGTNTLDFTFSNALNSVAINSRSSNTCGQGANYAFYLTKKTFGCSGSFAMTVFPNPTSEELTISMLPLNDSIEENKPKIDEAILVNSSGQISARGQRYGTDIKINVSGLKKGTYFLHVTLEGEVIKEQIFIE